MSKPRLRRLLGAGVAAAGMALGMVALTQSAASATTGTSPPGTYTPVQIAEWTYTSAGGRPVQLMAVAPKGLAGPLPTVIFATGYDTSFSQYATLTNELVSAGYLVVGIDGAGYSAVFPAYLAGGDTAVIDEIHDATTALPQAETALGSLIDALHVTLMGDSNGGVAATALGENSSYCDHSYQSFVSLGGGKDTQVIPSGWTGSCSTGSLAGNPPMLFQTGTIGRFSDPDWTDQFSANAYALASPPAAYVISNNSGHISSILCPSQILMAGGVPEEVTCTPTLDAEAASFRSSLVAWLNAYNRGDTTPNGPSMTTFEEEAGSDGLTYQMESDVAGPPPVTAVGIATDPATGGYWLLTSNGGVFNFNAPWYGSPKAAGTAGGVAVTGIAAGPNGKGYVISRANGGVFTFDTP